MHQLSLQERLIGIYAYLEGLAFPQTSSGLPSKIHSLFYKLRDSQPLFRDLEFVPVESSSYVCPALDSAHVAIRNAGFVTPLGRGDYCRIEGICNTVFDHKAKAHRIEPEQVESLQDAAEEFANTVFN